MAVVVLVRESPPIEAATPGLSALRKTATAVGTAGEAAPVPCPRCRPYRTASRREHQEGSEEEDWQPAVSIVCGAGHDHIPSATIVPAVRDGDRVVDARVAPPVALALPNDDDMSALADMSSARAVHQRGQLRTRPRSALSSRIRELRGDTATPRRPVGSNGALASQVLDGTERDDDGVDRARKAAEESRWTTSA